MSSRLQENAARMAGRIPADEPPAPPAGASVPPPSAPEPLPEVNIPEPPEDGPDDVPVHVAWSRVMGDVRAVSKDDQVTSGPARFAYRGVDMALNVFGPACRRHGVLVVPTKVDASYRDTKTSQNKPARECTVIVTYRIIGPRGDHIEVQAAGESLDSGDKGSAKAQAVALRTLLYHAGLVPTRDPDPDSVNVERGEAPVRSAADYRDEALNPNTALQRLYQIHHELSAQRMLGAVVVNEVGEEEPIGELVKRIGRERREQNGVPQ
ncbi:ERF family protein [Thermomonospora amylolytica]|uniref:ERF family protein n=1 Tax=Thermomonospora amylolytica TaxID=1411117 RepID=UPI000E6C7B7C|nr:ERF family protein [Thermomonospora amylolytica]